MKNARIGQPKDSAPLRLPLVGTACVAPVTLRDCGMSEIRHDHGAAHTHSHSHSHSHAPASFDRAFAIGIALNSAFVLLEVVYGVRANSLALVADAGHNLSDVLGLLLAWGATRLCRMEPTVRRTYGFRSSSILAALANAVVLLASVGWILWDAVQRFGHPLTVDAPVVITVSGIGILVNTFTALLFARGRKGDLNVRGAYLHMAADAAVSAGVMLSGVAVRLTGIALIDPVMSLVVVAVITWSTWGLFRESLDLALGAVPAGIDPVAVETYLESLPGVTGVHDLHIWGMSTTDAALTAHLVRPAGADDDRFLIDACRTLHDRFHIEHPTLQVERGNGPHACRLASHATAPASSCTSTVPAGAVR